MNWSASDNDGELNTNCTFLGAGSTKLIWIKAVR